MLRKFTNLPPLAALYLDVGHRLAWHVRVPFWLKYYFSIMLIFLRICDKKIKNGNWTKFKYIQIHAWIYSGAETLWWALRRDFIRSLFKSFSAFVSGTVQRYSGASSRHSLVTVSAEPSIFCVTAKIIVEPALPCRWCIRLTYFEQWSPLMTISSPLSWVGLGYFGVTQLGCRG